MAMAIIRRDRESILTDNNINIVIRLSTHNRVKLEIDALDETLILPEQLEELEGTIGEEISYLKGKSNEQLESTNAA